MIAPSEKHLEDWIVANAMPEFYSPHPFYKTLVARQLPLIHGITDLIYTNDTNIYIVELKKGRLDADALTQVLRYKGDLKRMWDYYMDTRPPIYEKHWLHNVETGYGNCPIGTVLVGHSIDDKTMSACEGADTTVWLYEYMDTGEYDFDLGHIPYTGDTEMIYTLKSMKQLMKKIYIDRRVEKGLTITDPYIDGMHKDYDHE